MSMEILRGARYAEEARRCWGLGGVDQALTTYVVAGYSLKTSQWFHSVIPTGE